MRKFAFLNAERGFHDDYHEAYMRSLVKKDKYCFLLDDLETHPEKLKELVKFDTVVVGSTGTNVSRLEPLFQAFRDLKYSPASVIFAPNEDLFIGIAWLMPKTKFYRLDYMDLEPYELEYLNKH